MVAQFKLFSLPIHADRGGDRDGDGGCRSSTEATVKWKGLTLALPQPSGGGRVPRPAAKFSIILIVHRQPYNCGFARSAPSGMPAERTNRQILTDDNPVTE